MNYTYHFPPATNVTTSDGVTHCGYIVRFRRRPLWQRVLRDIVYAVNCELADTLGARHFSLYLCGVYETLASDYVPDVQPANEVTS